MALRDVVQNAQKKTKSGAGSSQKSSGVPITHFKVHDQLCLVFGEDREVGRKLNRDPQSIVGEIKIGGKQYVIVASEDNEYCEMSSQRLVDILTTRQIQIAALVAAGKVNKQIAYELRISEWTVSTHLSRIFAKLGVDTRAAMVFRCSKLISN
ncbi:MAG: response regulator transcription factor [Syntrophobacteraceae bacterium]